MRNEAVIVVIGLVIFGVLIIYSGFQMFWNIPNKNAEIAQLQSRVEVWENRAMELEAAVVDYQRALKFQNLFLFIADANQAMELDKQLGNYMNNRAEFCLGDCRHE